MANVNVTEVVEVLKERFPDSVLKVIEFKGDITVVVKPEHLLKVCQFLRDYEPMPFNFLSDVGGVDMLKFPNRDKNWRFEVNYVLYSISTHQRLRLKVRLPEEDPCVDSVTSVWPGSNWHEREVFDMFGVRFEGHPDLRRILMPEDWDGHPLRKDYPLMGCGQREWYERQRRQQGAEEE